MRSSKYGSTLRYWPVPPWSPRCMWMSATSSVERGHRDELFAVGVRRRDRAQRRVEAHHVGAETDARRQERHAPRRGLQAEEEHALVELHRRDRARLAGVAEVRLERDRVERHERVHDLADLARPAQQADVGPAVRDDREVLAPTSGSSARTRAIGLRREPQPPMPTVMPSCTSATTSSIVTRLSGTGTPAPVSWSSGGRSDARDVRSIRRGVRSYTPPP